MVDQKPLLLGVDGGGTQSRARLSTYCGTVLAAAEGGPANLRLGIETSFTTILQIARQCLSNAEFAERHISRVIACLALAGASEPSQLAAAKQYSHPFRAAIITTDAHAACVGAHGGKDGKTGETLLKSVLAPMFALRNWRILSWVGHNIFGNRDGLVLDDPNNKASKIKTKDQVISSIVGYKPQTHVSIEYIESLDDWKTAWDHVHFRGFLGTKMTMQFTWQGCDSILAAPLVLDLARLALLAQRRDEFGIMRHLACFFKSPMGVEEHDFFKQFAMLGEYVKAQETAAV